MSLDHALVSLSAATMLAAPDLAREKDRAELVNAEGETVGELRIARAEDGMQLTAATEDDAESRPA